VPRDGDRTVLSRHNFRRTYHAALAKLADPTGELRPTAARTLKALRAGGTQGTDRLAVRLAAEGRPTKPATVQAALRGLAAAGLGPRPTAPDNPAGPWSPLPVPPSPMLDGLDLHGAHDLRHTFSTWLEDAGIPARVIDELMGHEATSRARQAPRQRDRRPLPTHHRGDGRPSHRGDRATADNRA
jgi:Phage integrase family